MFKITKNILISLGILISWGANLQALQRSHAIAITTVAAVGGGLYLSRDEIVRITEMPDGYTMPKKIVRAIIGAAVVGGAVGLLTRRYTPSGLLRRAQNAFPENGALVNLVRSDSSIIPTMREHYLTRPTPLADSFHDLSEEYAGCKKAEHLLNFFYETLEDPPRDEFHAKLKDEADKHKVLVDTTAPRIAAALMEIRAQPTFLKEQHAIYTKQTADAARRAAEAAEMNAIANTVNAAANISRIDRR